MRSPYSTQPLLPAFAMPELSTVRIDKSCGMKNGRHDGRPFCPHPGGSLVAAARQLEVRNDDARLLLLLLALRLLLGRRRGAWLGGTRLNLRLRLCFRLGLLRLRLFGLRFLWGGFLWGG